jgi:hypothetical protein
MLDVGLNRRIAAGRRRSDHLLMRDAPYIRNRRVERVLNPSEGKTLGTAKAEAGRMTEIV